MPLVDIPGVGEVEFPDTMTGDEVKAASARIYATRPPSADEPSLTQSQPIQTQSPGWYRGTVASALNTLVGGLMEGAAGSAGPQGSLRSLPSPAAGAPWVSPEAKEAATYAVPQTATQAGALIGTGAAGLLPGGMLARVAGGLGGGALGALSEGQDPMGPEMVDVAKGLGLGEGAGLLAKGGGGLISALARIVPGAEGRIAGQDAQKVLAAAENISPGLTAIKPPTTAAEGPIDKFLYILGLKPTAAAQDIRTLGPDAANNRLWNLAHATGRPALSNEREQAIQAIEQASGGEIPIPPSMRQAPGAMSTITGVQPRETIPLREALQELTDIGNGLRHANIVDRSVRQQETAKAYGQLIGEIRAGLEAKSPGLGAALDATQADYRSGLALIGKKELGKGAAWDEGTTAPPQVDMRTLQMVLKDPMKAAELKKALGEKDFNTWVDTVTRGAGIGAVDVPPPGGGTSISALQTWLRRGGSLTELPTALVEAGLPGLGRTYVGAAGRRPYANLGQVTPEMRALMDVLMLQGRAPTSSISIGPIPGQ